MTTITFDNFQSPARERTPDAPSYSVKKVLLFSLLLHIALILAIASQSRTPPATKTEPDPIKARLYIAPSPQPDVNDASPSAQDLFSGSHSTLAEETGEQQKAEAEAETGAIDDADTLPTAATESDEIASSRAAISETEKSRSSSALPAQQSPQPARRLSLGNIDAAREVLRQQYAEAIKRDARQAAADYQRLKTQPEIIDPRKGQEEEAPVVKPVEVNCEDTTNAILTTLSGFTGGTLKCSERHGFEEFVDKRVKK